MKSFTRNLRRFQTPRRNLHGISYTPKKVEGVSFAGRETPTATGSLSVVINAGSRYQPDAGVSHLLEKFAFKTTEERSALRITRESELLGGQLSTQITREHIILTARFLNEYLEYYARLLAEVVDATKFLPFQLTEEVLPTARIESELFREDILRVAMAKLHEKAFHRGIGNEVYLPASASPSISEIKDFASKAYVKSNFSVISSGPDVQKASDLCAKYFAVIPDGSPLKSAPTKISSGESRVYSKGTNYFCLGFPAPAASPELFVLSSILGGDAAVKWSHGNTLLAKAAGTASEYKATAVADLTPYSDASLLSVVISGSCPKAIKATASESFKALKSLSSNIPNDVVKSGIAMAKTKYLSAFEPATLNAISASSLVSASKGPDAFISGFDKVTPASISKVVSSLLAKPASTVAVGNLDVLPYYDEL